MVSGAQTPGSISGSEGSPLPNILPIFGAKAHDPAVSPRSCKGPADGGLSLHKAPEMQPLPSSPQERGHGGAHAEEATNSTNGAATDHPRQALHSQANGTAPTTAAGSALNGIPAAHRLTAGSPLQAPWVAGKENTQSASSGQPACKVPLLEEHSSGTHGLPADAPPIAAFSLDTVRRASLGFEDAEASVQDLTVSDHVQLFRMTWSREWVSQQTLFFGIVGHSIDIDARALIKLSHDDRKRTKDLMGRVAADYKIHIQPRYSYIFLHLFTSGQFPPGLSLHDGRIWWPRSADDRQLPNCCSSD